MAKHISDYSFDESEVVQSVPGQSIAGQSIAGQPFGQGVAPVSAQEEAVLEQVRSYVHQASQLLKSLDADRARVGWLLEDALMYLEEIDTDALFDRIDPIDIDQAIQLPRTSATAGK